MTREERFNYRQSRIIMELPTRALNNKYLEKNQNSFAWSIARGTRIIFAMQRPYVLRLFKSQHMHIREK